MSDADEIATLDGSDPAPSDAIEPSDDGWFLRIVRQHTQSLLAEQGGLVAPWRAAHPELDDVALARQIVRRGARDAALIGGASGIATPLAVWAGVGVAFAEVAALERLQLRMLLTLAELGGRPLSDDDVGEILTLYAHVLKVKGATQAATMGRKALIALSQRIALRFMQRASVRLFLPVVAVGLGGGMNYLMTRGLGQHALSYFDLLPTALEADTPVLLEDLDA